MKLGDTKQKETIGFIQYFSRFIKRIKEIMKNINFDFHLEHAGKMLIDNLVDSDSDSISSAATILSLRIELNKMVDVRLRTLIGTS